MSANFPGDHGLQALGLRAARGAPVAEPEVVEVTGVVHPKCPRGLGLGFSGCGGVGGCGLVPRASKKAVMSA
jgi:hypothetical protein